MKIKKTIDEISKNIESLIQNEDDRASLGVYVQAKKHNSSNYEIIYKMNHQKYFCPASNTKILTSIASLIQFGSEYKIITIFHLSIENNIKILTVKTQGDPTITSDTLKNVAKQIKERGFHVEKIIIDDSLFNFKTVSFPQEWTWGFINYYGPQPHSCIFNKNTFKIRVYPSEKVGDPLNYSFEFPFINIQVNSSKSITLDNNNPTKDDVSVFYDLKSILNIKGSLKKNSETKTFTLCSMDPKSFFTSALEYYLKTTDVTIDMKKIDTSIQISTPITEIIHKSLLDSDNLYAEILLLLIGNSVKNDDIYTSGRMQIQKILSELGVPKNSFNIFDGSGLTEKNNVSPEALIEILKLLYDKTPYGKLFHSFLPDAGKTGTLRNRFKNNPGILQAKTGSLSGVSALSGYIQNVNYEKVVFSIILNHSSLPVDKQRDMIDKIALMFVKFEK